MKNIFSIIAVLFCLQLQAQPPRNVPVNPDSIKLGYLSNGVVVYSTVGELTRTKTPLAKHILDSLSIMTAVNSEITNRINSVGLKLNTSDSALYYASRFQRFIDSGRAVQKIDNTSTSLRSYATKAALIAAGTNTTINIMWIGDSVGGDVMYPMQQPLFQAHGVGGQHGGGNQVGVFTALAGGAATVGTNILITTLTRSGTTATATSAAHGLTNGTSVVISGAANTGYNGTYTISNVTTNTFDYTISSSSLPSPDGSSTIYFAQAPDFNKWITGSWVNVPAGGSYAYYRVSGGGINTLSTATTKFKVFYTMETTGGTFKIQTSPDGTTYTDATGFTNVSANYTTDSLGIATVPSALNYVRVVGLTGNVKVVGMGWETDKGVRFSYLLAPGGSVMKNYASTPARIWKAYLNDFEPDLITVMFKDDTDAGLIAALPTFQTYITATNPNATTVWMGATGGIDESLYSLTNKPYAQTMAAQNKVIRDFVDTTTISGAKYFWDGTKYSGSWQTAAARGMFDAGTLSSVSSATISGTTATITTASPHGITGTSTPLRVSNVYPNQYNGLWLNPTVVSSTQLSYTINGSLPTTSGSGGVVSSTDLAHLSSYGRTVLASAFMRDFSMLDGLNGSYPFTLGSNVISTNSIATTNTANVFSAKQKITNTTPVSGQTATATDADGAFVLQGGMFGRSIKLDDTLYLGSNTSNGQTTLNRQTNVANTGSVGVSLIVSSSVPSTSSSGIIGLSVIHTLSPTSTANVTGNGNNNGSLRTENKTTGSGTGNISADYGLYQSFNYQGTQTATAIYGNYQDWSLSSAAVGSIFGHTIDFRNIPSATNAYAYHVGANLGSQSGITNKWAFYNASSAQNFLGSAGSRVGSSTGPLIGLTGTGSPEGVITAPIGSDYRNLSGGAGVTLYIKESGTGNTGWIAK